ncbi:hypothetical protein BDQ17DRAFT_1042603 [Cyathus striatus]|nr:hypothetical protein BDQ17DRAFT_1042603 [Cyathus striatus]
MLFNFNVFLFVFAFAASANAQMKTVFTDIKVYHTTVSDSPFLVERTTTITWTQGPSPTEP